MRVKRRNSRVLGKRKWASSKGVTGFSDRSGLPYRYSDMIIEPGTGLWIHKSESDGAENITEAFRDPKVPSDAQKLKHGRNIPSEAFIDSNSLFIEDNSSIEGVKLFIDRRGQEALEQGDIDYD